MMLEKLIKGIYNAGRQAGYNEAELKYKEEIHQLEEVLLDRTYDTIDIEGIEELDEI